MAYQRQHTDYRRFLYEALTDHPDWAEGDNILIGFRDSCDQAPIGQLRTVAEYAALGLRIQALSLNSQITTTEPMELNDQEVNHIWLYYMGSTPDSSAIATLEGIAYQCPVYGGPAVARARSMLYQHQLQTFDTTAWYDFPDTCSASPYRRGQAPEDYVHEASRTEWQLKAYPNPATQELILSYKLEKEDGSLTYELIDALGRVKKKIALPPHASNYHLNISELASGIYFAAWRINGKLVQADRQLVWQE